MISNLVGKPDGNVIADSPGSASLTVLRAWLAQWEHVGRPAPDMFSTRLVPHEGADLPGWDLHVLPFAAAASEVRNTNR